jgi:putative membrane protein
MNLLAQLAALAAAAIHVYFFLLESVWFRQPRVWARFGVGSAEEAETVRSFAYNQGFYNLFLAIGVGLGLVLIAAGSVEAGRALVLFACGSMVAAGAVLYLHTPGFLRAAAIQAVPPLLAILMAIILR